jgi:hypothetical protein
MVLDGMDWVLGIGYGWDGLGMGMDGMDGMDEIRSSERARIDPKPQNPGKKKKKKKGKENDEKETTKRESKGRTYHCDDERLRDPTHTNKQKKKREEEEEEAKTKKPRNRSRGFRRKSW